MSAPGTGTRRQLLGSTAAAAAAVVGGVLVAGCGGAAPHHQHLVGSASARAHDAALLNRALAVEQHSIHAYEAVAPLLAGVARAAASQFLADELLHAGELRKLLKGLHAAAHSASANYNLGHPHGERQLLALLHGLEQLQISAYLHAIPRLSSGELRQTLAAIMANDAQHVTVLRSELGMPDLTAPFLTATE